MKNTKTNGAKRRSLLAIALIAVIGFSFIACGEAGGGGTGSDGSGSGSGWIEVKNNPFNVVTNTEFGETSYLNSISAIAYGNGKFVAACYCYDGKRFYNQMGYSSDGTTWKIVEDNPFPDSSVYVNVIAFGNGIFVAGGGNDYPMRAKIAYSSDGGITWSKANQIIDLKGKESTGIRKIVFGNGKFIAIGANREGDETAYSSSDGANWPAISNFPLEFIHDIAFGNGRFVASHKHGIAHSSDGITWSALEAPIKASVFGAQCIKTIAYSDDGRFFAGGDSGIMVYWKSK